MSPANANNLDLISDHSTDQCFDKFSANIERYQVVLYRLTPTKVKGLTTFFCYVSHFWQFCPDIFNPVGNSHNQIDYSTQIISLTPYP
ncbi:MAG: hypothetical protein AAB541_03015, partial [Patescibacteria group bacterium]